MAKRKKQAGAKLDGEKPAVQLDIPLPKADDEIGSEAWWRGELEDSWRRLKREVTSWQGDLARYDGGKPKLPGADKKNIINVNVQFYNAENKKPQLFYEQPDMVITPRFQGGDTQAHLLKHVLNAQLGEHEIDVDSLIEEVLNDCLVVSGISATKIGYDCVKVDVPIETKRRVPQIDEAGKPVIDPMTARPVMTLATNEDGTPETELVPKTIWEQYYWRHIDGERLRLPVGFRSSRYDQAPWIGWVFDVNAQTLREMGVSDPADGDGEISPDDTLAPIDDREFIKRATQGVEIFYRAFLFDPKEKNPERIRQLVLIYGRGRRPHAIVHRDLPWQRFDDSGAFVSGMRGYPIHPCVLRYRPGSAFPKSDAAVLRDVADEKSLHRTLMVTQRRRNLPKYGYDRNQVDKQTLDQLERADTQGMVGFNGPPNSMVQALQQSSYPPENFRIDDITQNDIDRLAASGSNQQGVQSADAQTATEARIVDQASQTRMAKERKRLIRWYMRGVEKLSSLLQIYATQESVLPIVGEAGSVEWQKWDKNKIQGRYAFSAQPDSAQRIDNREDREVLLRAINLFANVPGVNVLPLVTRALTRMHLNPTGIVETQPPPPPDPPKEQPRVSLSFSFKGEDLHPSSGQYSNVVYMAKLAGIETGGLSPVQGGEPAPEGVVREARGVAPISKHADDRSGRLPGPSGAPAM